MKLSTTLRATAAAALITSLALTGCSTRGPLAVQVGVDDENGFEVFAKPVNQDAYALARSWAKDAQQTGVMLNRSPKGVQDAATFVFTSNSKDDRMLIVIAAKGGLEGKEIAVAKQNGKALDASLPLTRSQTDLMNSKKLFKAAEAAGLKGAEDVVVLNVRGANGPLPVAIVTDESGKKSIILNAANGDALTTVQTLGGRRLEAHVIIIGAVVLAAAIGGAVYWAVKKWREKPKPTTAPTTTPSGQPTAPPTPIPIATPVPTPVPTSHPISAVAQILAKPFGDQFEHLDADKDGKLIMAEYLKPATDDATKRVKTNEFNEFLDGDHNGFATRAQFLGGIERSITHMCGVSMSLLDGNQDRGLDKGEVGTGLSADEFNKADTNNDGKLSQNEYLAPFALKEAQFAQYYR